MKENKLIAEFMGRIKTFDIVDNDTYRGEVTLSKGLIEEQIEPEISHFEDRYSVKSIAIEENLKYHESWDWLMPVIQKCLIGEAEHNEDVSNLAIKNIYEGICNQDISLAYESVVKFINQSNK
jgi:hypothetical protein